MKKTKEEQVEACFSKYVETAIKRARRDYMIKEYKQEAIEQLSGLEVILNMEGSENQEWNLSEDIENVPWEAEAIHAYMDKIIGNKMEKLLHRLTDDEMVIVFAKVYRQCTFVEISQIMGVKWQKVASSYYYALKKLKKGWGENEF